MSQLPSPYNVSNSAPLITGNIGDGISGTDPEGSVPIFPIFRPHFLVSTSQQIVQTGFCTGLCIDLFYDNRAVKRIPTVRRRQVAVVTDKFATNEQIGWRSEVSYDSYRSYWRGALTQWFTGWCPQSVKSKFRSPGAGLVVALLLLVLVAVACGGSQRAEPSPSPTAGPSLSLSFECAVTEVLPFETPMLLIGGKDPLPSGFDAVNSAECTFSDPVAKVTLELLRDGDVVHSQQVM